MLRAYRDRRLSGGAAPATVNQSLVVLSSAYRLAKKDGLTHYRPDFPLLQVHNARAGFFEYEQFLALRSELPEWLRPVFTFAYNTGCRKSEILALRWSQVDFSGSGEIRLNPGETKNKQARTIPLTRELYDLLLMLKEQRDLYWPHCELVFSRLGEPIKCFARVWRSACQRAGLWDAETGKHTRVFHDLRRSALRDMIRSGTPEKVSMAISGHKTRAVFDRYQIVSGRDLKQAAQRLDEYRAAASENRKRTTNELKTLPVDSVQ
jgi:integrase